MASNYKYKIGSASAATLDTVAAVATDVLKQMNDNTFTGADYGFTDKNTIIYMSSATQINGGHWGKSLTLPYKYLKSSNNTVTAVPFADPTTMPAPTLTWESDTEQYVQSFPPTGIASTTHSVGSVTYTVKQAYIDLSAASKNDPVIITYNSSNSYITVSDSTRDYITLKAYPCVLIDLQAPGGKGGTGAYFQHSNLLGKQMAVAGGGGGGSGGFARLSVDLSNSANAVKIYRLVTGAFEVHNEGTNNYLLISQGADGANGTALDTDSGAGNAPKGTGGSGGNGGKVRVCDSGGGTYYDGTECRRKTLGNLYIVDVVPGAKGANGSGTQATGSYEGRTNTTVNGGSPTRQVYLTSNTNSQTQCVKYGTTAQTYGGRGEMWDDTKPVAMAGGGGGAASIMSDGGSWNAADAKIGAGGHGQSGWTNMSTYNYPPGGPGAIWISYISKA